MRNYLLADHVSADEQASVSLPSSDNSSGDWTFRLLMNYSLQNPTSSVDDYNLEPRPLD
jgi:hypothetical protein